MVSGKSGRCPLRLAVLTPSISHFEAPLFRLCAKREELEFKVFYIHPIKALQSVDTDYGQKIDWGGDILGGYSSARLECAAELEGAARDWKADVFLINGYGWPGAAGIILRSRWRGQALVHRGTLNFHHDPRRPIKGRLLRPLGRMLLRLFHAHHYGGEYSRKVLRDAGVKEAALFFVPYSVDTPYFLSAASDPNQKAAAMALRQSLGWSPDAQVLLFIAQHNWFKGPDLALEVFREVAKFNDRARFLVVGSGRMTEEMKESARRNLPAGTYHFAGFIPSTETVAYYLASDLALCTSRYETWARMVNEAMLCRCPCVVSRIVPAAGGLVVHGENGFVVKAPDVSRFVMAIKDYFALSDADRNRIRDAARSKAQLFAYEPHMSNVLAAAQYALHQADEGTPQEEDA